VILGARLLTPYMTNGRIKKLVIEEAQ
jgi:hypothetical protein